MLLNKFLFTPTQPNISTSTNEDLLRSLKLPLAKLVKINSIELTGVQNPSEIVITLLSYGRRLIINLYRFRTEFILQNGVFIWDTKHHKFFEVWMDDNQGWDLSVQVDCKSEFELTMYYSTDQKMDETYKKEV